MHVHVHVHVDVAVCVCSTVACVVALTGESGGHRQRAAVRTRQQGEATARVPARVEHSLRLVVARRL